MVPQKPNRSPTYQYPDRPERCDEALPGVLSNVSFNVLANSDLKGVDTGKKVENDTG